MKSLLFIAPLAALIALPAHAQSTRTTTVDTPNYDGTRIVTRDGAGNVSRDTDVTRKSDGATASRDVDRTKTDTGYTASGSASGFDGKSVSYAGSRTKTDTGYTTSQSLTGGGGTTLWSRDKSVSRVGGRVDKSVDVSRASGFSRGRVVSRRGFGRR
ncbi:MAG: hypothetical protein V4459_11040 [Pseudomonadota bacterium]